MRSKPLRALSALTLAAALTLPAAYAETEEPSADAAVPQTVLVGLAYGSGALAGANLANKDSSGFRFGYLDAERSFISLGCTEETAISVVKTQNVFYGVDPQYSESLRCYSDAITSDVAVGCWHVQLPMETAPASYEEALPLAQTVGGFPAWINGTWQVRLGAYTSQEEAQAAAEAAGGSVAGTSAYGVSVVKTGTAAILFQFDGGEELSLTVAPGLDDSVKPVTYYRSNRYYGMFQFRRVSGGNLTIINALELDDYTNCVITQEMSPSWPLEALKAQALCARTYWETNKKRHGSSGFDLCSTTHCQAYPGMGAITERTTQATQETAGLRIWYQGKPVSPFYFSSDGGATEDVENVWGSPYGYLKGVVDPYEATVSEKISNWEWSYTFTGAELAERLQKNKYNSAAITGAKVEHTPLGNVKKLILTDANGKEWPLVRQTGVRDILGLRSMRYDVTVTGENSGGVYYTDGGGTISAISGTYAIGGDGRTKKLSGNPYVITASGTQYLPAPYGGSTEGNSGPLTFTFSGSGWGHNVGMSQWGAYAMAQQGFTYDQIIKFYYTDVEIY